MYKPPVLHHHSVYSVVCPSFRPPPRGSDFVFFRGTFVAAVISLLLRACSFVGVVKKQPPSVSLFLCLALLGSRLLLCRKPFFVG